jgi:hypothetical protein
MDRIFEAKAPRTAPFGIVGWIFIGTILGGIPLIGLATVVGTMGASDPVTTLVVALVCLIPIGILYALHRLFTKFRLTLFSDGAIEFVQPFKTTRIAKDQLAGAHWRSNYVAATKTRMNWLILSDRAGKGLEAISPMSFGAGALNDFVAALQTAHPGLSVTSE